MYDLLLNYSKLEWIGMTNCIHISQPLSRQAPFHPTHILHMLFLPACRSWFILHPDLEVCSSEPYWVLRYSSFKTGSNTPPSLNRLLLPIPLHQVNLPSPRWHYVYSTFSIIFGLKELVFITITLNSFQCYTANFIIQPRIS